MSREHLAFDAGITAGSLARIELSKSVPGWDTVRCIIRSLDVSLEELAIEIEEDEGTRRRSLASGSEANTRTRRPLAGGRSR